ncbi:hypothetical protein [Campylobacter sp. 19-13652]|uniref:hypothetical protein n=1 Tax=Campylobacter sp. 19-13652 TaxID=2840180 RepID=UPI001C84B173|nr:hypothetical protein [Campylobacter sp. 19-13652]
MRLKTAFGVAIVAAILSGCYNQPAPATNKTKFKTINVSGIVTKVSFTQSGYCYELMLKQGRSVPLCKAKQHYSIGDTITYSRDKNGVVKTSLIKQASTTKAPILRKPKPKKSKISPPKNETISFD